MEELTLTLSERTSFRLRSLYEASGYGRFNMNKFEEYDLYAKNKEFLISDNVITFTDLSGKLMALKPDVTLSIVKNGKDLPELQQKLYYHETVYRADKGSRSFRELMQVGLECIGKIDDYCILEVLTLAGKSLQLIREDCILDISHLGVVTGVLDSIGIPKDKRDEVLACIGQKNTHELSSLCREWGIEESSIQILTRLVRLGGSPEAVLPELRSLLKGVCDLAPVDQLERMIHAMAGTGIEPILRLDFSAVDDIHYYNGIVFKGFVRGLPGSILSGGQYDNLMRRMRRRSGAIGFAVYMDLLGRLPQERPVYDVDTLLLYDDHADMNRLHALVQQLRTKGEHVMVQRVRPETVRCRKILKLTGSEVEILENNA